MESFLSRYIFLFTSKWHHCFLALWLIASGLPAAHLEAQNLQAIEKRLARGIRKGDLTKEQAAVMIQALKEHQVSKKKTTGVTSQDEMARRKERYMAAEKKMKAMVQQGEISEEVAKDKLMGMRKELFGESGGKQDEMARRKERYMAAEKKMKAMVKKGEISERDAEDKLMGIRKELFGESRGKQDEMARRKERYLAAEKKLIAMVEKGEISKQAAKERLEQYRKKMAQEP